MDLYSDEEENLADKSAFAKRESVSKVKERNPSAESLDDLERLRLQALQTLKPRELTKTDVKLYSDDETGKELLERKVKKSKKKRRGSSEARELLESLLPKKKKKKRSKSSDSEYQKKRKKKKKSSRKETSSDSSSSSDSDSSSSNSDLKKAWEDIKTKWEKKIKAKKGKKRTSDSD